MPSYDVPKMMAECFYQPLTAAGWVTTGTRQGDEWASPDGDFEIAFSHSASTLHVRYRRHLPRIPQEPTETYLDRKKAAGWNSLHREYGYTATSMEEWAQRTLMTIATWCESMRSVAVAPGE